MKYLVWFGGALAVAAVLFAAAAEFYPPLNSYIQYWYYWNYAYCTPYFDKNYLYFPVASGSPRARVIINPGNGINARAMAALPAAQTWLAGLRDIGADAVILNTFHPPACWFNKDGGKEYRTKFLRMVDDIEDEVAARHGAAPTIVSGISLGGLHAMIAYAAQPECYVGWQADISVTRIDAMQELVGIGEAPAFNPFHEVQHLQGSPGYLTWGTKDERVNYRLTEQLSQLIRSPHVTTISYPGEPHMWDTAHVQGLLADAKAKLALAAAQHRR